MDVDFSNSNELELGEREKEILRVVSEEHLAGFTFGGIRRKSGLHPEMLSRVLDRLESAGIVTKGSRLDGLLSRSYTVAPEARKFLRPYRLTENRPRFQLVRTLLPSSLSIEHILPSLVGRWFGTVRWLGYSESESGIVLKWISEDGIQLDAMFSNGELEISAKLENEGRLNDALRLAYRLLGSIAGVFPSPGSIRPVGDFYGSVMAA